MKRKLRWSLLLVTLAAFAIWLEPTRVFWGWLRGEAFYQGRPTSYWARVIERWQFIGIDGGGPGEGVWTQQHYRCCPTPWEEKMASWLRFDKAVWDRTWPTLLDGDSTGEPVLRELARDPSAYVRAWAAEGLDRLTTDEKGPSVHRTYGNRKPTPADVHRIGP